MHLMYAKRPFGIHLHFVFYLLYGKAQSAAFACTAGDSKTKPMLDGRETT